LNNTYTFCLKTDLARKHRLKTIGDLGRVPGLRIVVDLDFSDRPDGWKGMVERYGLKLPEPQRVELSFRYKALRENVADVALGYVTDWEIDADDLATLEDDLHYFPNYHAVPVVREDMLERHPEIGTVLNRLKGQIDDKTMRRLNLKVARLKRPEVEIARVAREFLEQRGLLTGGGGN
jgi:glycine betaine/choline ABC-type transport system substrate-binding protein